jgi:hypothetical protein
MSDKHGPRPSLIKIRCDAIKCAKVTGRDGEVHCISTGTQNPDSQSILAATQLLERIYSEVKAHGTREVRSLFVVLARGRGVCALDSTVPIQTHGDFVDLWKDANITLVKCKLFYEITYLYSQERPSWLSDTCKTISNEMNLDIFGKRSDKYANFIEELTTKNCELNARSFLKSNRNTEHQVGLTRRKLDDHPMGPAENVKGKQFFRYQNVHNWHLLCARDPVAMAIYQDKVNGRNQGDSVDEAIERHSRVELESTSGGGCVMIPHMVSVVGGDNSSIAKSKMSASIQPKRVPFTNETPAVIGIPIVTTQKCVVEKLVEIANDKTPDCYETPLLTAMTTHLSNKGCDAIVNLNERTTHLSVKGCDDIVNFDQVKTHQGVTAAAGKTLKILAAGDTISAMTKETGSVQTEVSLLCFLTVWLVL